MIERILLIIAFVWLAIVSFQLNRQDSINDDDARFDMLLWEKVAKCPTQN